MSKDKPLEGNSPREVAATINNAMLAASRPENVVITEDKLRKLSAYATAVVEPCEEHLREGLLSYQELVFVFLSAALIVQAGHNVGTDKIPMFNLAKRVMKNK